MKRLLTQRPVVFQPPFQQQLQTFRATERTRCLKAAFPNTNIEKMDSAGAGTPRGVEFLVEPGMVLLDAIIMTGIAVSEIKRVEEETEGEIVGEITSAVIWA